MYIFPLAKLPAYLDSRANCLQPPRGRQVEPHPNEAQRDIAARNEEQAAEEEAKRKMLGRRKSWMGFWKGR